MWCCVGVVVVVGGGGSEGVVVCSVVVGGDGPTPLNQLQHSAVWSMIRKKVS